MPEFLDPSLEPTVEAYAEAWIEQFCDQYCSEVERRIKEIQYTDEVAVECHRYLGECFMYGAKLGKYQPLSGAAAQPPQTSLHPIFKTMVEQAAAKEVQRWRAGQAQFPVMQRSSTMQRSLSPFELDRANPRILDLERNRLLNYNPSAYFQRQVNWEPPARFNCYMFMARFGFEYLAPYTERVRVTTDGRVNVQAASKEWVQIFGIGYDFTTPESPLKLVNEPRLQEISNPQFVQFLEQIG